MPQGHTLYKAQDGWGGIISGARNAVQGAAPAAPSSGGGGADPYAAFTDLILQQMQQELAGGGSSSSQSSGSTVVMPPVLELLAEMRARRQAEADQAGTIAQIMSMNLPEGMTVFPGFEGGGLADVLMGIITGRGAEAHGIIPDAARQVHRTNVPIPQGQPSVESEAGSAQNIAQQIMNALRVIQTSQSSSGSVQNPATAAAGPTGAAASNVPAGFLSRI